MHPLGILGGLGEETIGRLVGGLEGALVTPDDETYDTARDVWNGLINRYPALVVQAASAADVGHAIAFAREQDLPLSVRAGAHHQTGSAVAENGLVIDLGELDHVTVDPEAETAVVGPGNTTAEALAATQEHGLAFPTGSAGAPGVAGTTLGGGIGWLRRRDGLAVDRLRRLEVVTADGTVREVTPEREADLFWALRGGGGGMGVVTELEFDCAPVGPVVGGLTVAYPIDRADEVLAAVRAFHDSAPPEASIICNLGEIPAVPGMPPALHGEPAVLLIGCHAGDPETGLETFAPLRAIGDDEPLLDNSGPIPYAKLHEMGTLLHPWGRKYVHRSAFVDELTDELGTLLRERARAAPGPMDGVGVWPLGGAVGSGPAAATPWADREHMLVVEAAWDDHANTPHLEWARETDRQLRAAGAEGAYPGYVGVEEQPDEDWAERVYGPALERLRAVKAEHDPEDVLGGPIEVAPGSEAG